MTGAAAIFVKTPGHSPLKTRLARRIGREQAEAFHRQSSACVAAVLRDCAQSIRLTPYFAIAEPEAMSHSLWSEFDRVCQGDGGLGERMHRVYQELLSRHQFVILLGADSPHLPVQTLIRAAQSLDVSAPQFSIGRCDDGGFYLFGGNHPLPEELWTSVRYSQPTTADDFAAAVREFGSLKELPMLIDVDTAEDLPLLQTALEQQSARPAEQSALLEWLAHTVRSM